MVEQLIILGNGFDLACGLSSTYGDFLRHVFWKNDTTLEKVASVVGMLSNSPDFYEKTQQFLPDEINLNIWYLLLVHSKISRDSNWVDVEKQLHKYLMGKLITGILSVSKGPFQPLDIDNHIYSFSRIAYKQFNEIEQVKKFSKETITNILMKKLNQMEQDFNSFLFEAGYSNESLYFPNAENLIKKILLDGNYDIKYNVLTFNYTDPWRWRSQGWPGELVPNRFSMVHGQAMMSKSEHVDGVSRIIFGIDHSNISTNQLEYRFTKTYRTLIMQSSRTKEITQNVFEKDIKVIKFYGHSFGEADYSYFQQMFDFYDLYHNNDLKLIFYYCMYGDKTKEQVLQEQVTAITRLIEKYGETMNNMNHGKNLLTRLQQTKRIFVKEITYE